MPFPEHLEALAPEMLLAGGAMLLLVADVWLPKERRGITLWLSIALLAATGITLLFVMQPAPVVAFYGQFVLDPLAVWAKLLVLFGAAFTLLVSARLYARHRHRGEYALLLLWASVGLMLMASAPGFVTFYLGLELASLSLYVLVGYERNVLRSAEGAVKYFVLGALSSGLLLYGMSYLYAVAGTLDFAGMGKALASAPADARLAVALGLVFVVAGVAFKVSLAPFHMWTPDAYEGAPTPITGFLSTAAKVGVFVVFIRLVHDALAPLADKLAPMLALLALASMLVGNIAAIVQRNIKRMLAYSTIGHAGFISLGLLAGGEGYAALLAYLTIYLVMGIAAFAIVELLTREGFVGEAIEDYAGLSRTHPGYAAAMGLLMFSLAGIPPLAGFWAKYYVLVAVIHAGWIKLAVAALVFSVIGAYYYIRVVKAMYFDAPREELPALAAQPAPTQAVAAFGALFVLALGLYPDPVLAICRAALLASF